MTPSSPCADLNRLFRRSVAAATALLLLLLAAQLWALPSRERAATDAGSEATEIRVRVPKDEWRWEPDVIRARPGERLRLRITNEDDYDHGFAISELGIDRKVAAGRETEIELVAPAAGEYRFYCSVLCGKGHFDQSGLLIVE